MAIIERKNRDGTVAYQVRVRQMTSRTFERRADAKEYERQCLNQRRLCSEGMARFQRFTLDEFFPFWLDEFQRARVTAGWLKDLSRYYERFVRPFVGTKAVSKIAVDDVAFILREMERQGLSAQMRLHVYNLLHKLFADCLAEGWLVLNPAHARLRPKVRLLEASYLTRPQISALLQTARGSDVETGVWLQLVCGLRQGEVAALRWSDLDFDSKRIRIARTFRRKESAEVLGTKNGRQHVVALDVPELWAVLETSRARSRSEYVVSNRSGWRMSHGTYLKRLQALCSAAGVPYLGSHALRHSASELWMHQGATAADLSFLLNHASPSTTRRYTHGQLERLGSLSKGLRVLGGDAPVAPANPAQTSSLRLVHSAE
jgi:integrase